MRLNCPDPSRTFELGEPVFEKKDAGVRCYCCRDEAWGECFIKVQDVRGCPDRRTARRMLELSREEARAIRQASQYTSRIPGRVPRLFASWEEPNRAVIVMEKMPGTTLRTWMETYPAQGLGAEDVFLRSRLILQLCEIMRDIRKGSSAMVHRDLKPENIYISPDKTYRWKIGWKVSVIDFGCANLGVVRHVGTADYQSPEQKVVGSNSGVGITSKTDVFAIGQIFFELLTGRVPVIGSDYQIRARQEQWSAVPQLPMELLELHGMDKLSELLRCMTAFRGKDRPIYDKIIQELKRVEKP